MACDENVNSVNKPRISDDLLSSADAASEMLIIRDTAADYSLNKNNEISAVSNIYDVGFNCKNVEVVTSPIVAESSIVNDVLKKTSSDVFYEGDDFNKNIQFDVSGSIDIGNIILLDENVVEEVIGLDDLGLQNVSIKSGPTSEIFQNNSVQIDEILEVSHDGVGLNQPQGIVETGVVEIVTQPNNEENQVAKDRKRKKRHQVCEEEWTVNINKSNRRKGKRYMGKKNIDGK
ncbi:hypothetical protein J6590_099263 [Homalodisca vitripennis]|nr:hypothetical protein J6590_099263 [Homalodisca vitripennis]